MKKELLLLFIGYLPFLSTAQFWDFSEPKRLPGTVNTERAEESIPIFSKDSSILYFVRTWDPDAVGGEMDQDIWFSKKAPDGSYGECQLLKDVNNKYNNAVIGMDKSGSKMYILNSYEGKKDLVKGLASTAAEKGKWGKPKEIQIPTLDIEGDFYGFHVSEDEKVIIISYAGPGTNGLEDLYVSLKEGDAWSAPINMGSVLNTKGYEISPFLSKTKDTLFFSSNGHGGQGDADIFYSVKQGSWTSWSAPVNLGKKINSPKFDAYFTYSSNTIYWSSNRESEKSDIYMASILTPPPLTLTCSGEDVTTFNGMDGKLFSTVGGGVGPYTYAWSNGANTEDPVGVPAGEYTIRVTDAIGQTAECLVKINQPAPIDLTLKHYFDYNANKFTVTEGKLRDFVKQVEAQIKMGRKSVTIDINSSASYVPTKTFVTNDKLALSRANKIKGELDAYFAKAGLKDKVKVVIVSAIVQGPAYNKDFENRGKYREYQYIALSTK